LGDKPEPVVKKLRSVARAEVPQHKPTATWNPAAPLDHSLCGLLPPSDALHGHRAEAAAVPPPPQTLPRARFPISHRRSHSHYVCMRQVGADGGFHEHSALLACTAVAAEHHRLDGDLRPARDGRRVGGNTATAAEKAGRNGEQRSGASGSGPGGAGAGGGRPRRERQLRQKRRTLQQDRNQQEASIAAPLPGIP
jgi:hypothetical protein